MIKRTRNRSFVSYTQHLESVKFSLAKKIAYLLAFKRCTICWQRFHLEAHHLWYGCLGKWYEFLFLRYVCDNHHDQVGVYMGVRLHGALALHLNYYRVKFFYLCTIGTLRFLKWVIISYALPRKYPQ